MPWVVGIDEAGYGPNLGPFVMASVACRLPAERDGADLWHLLKEVVRRHKDRDDGRLLIEDSKVVYSPGKGLKRLERGVLAALKRKIALEGLNLAAWLEQTVLPTHAELREECWYHGATSLPVQADPDDLVHAAGRWRKTCERARVIVGPARCVVVCPARFNAVLERWKNKSVVLILALAELLQHAADPDHETEDVLILVDKHGGRNNYESVLRQALPNCRIEPKQESATRSEYHVHSPTRTLRIQFEPRADGSHFPVALASMLAKYVRELLMLEFNQFWRTHLPDLTPTAGYPGDAGRFMDAIRPVAARLGIAEKALWRQK